MAKHEKLESLSIEASADLSTHQFKFMAYNSSGQIALQTSSSALCVGVLQDKPSAAGQVGEVAYDGRVKVIAGAAITAGAEVMSNTSGLAITAATSGNRVQGMAMTTVTASGQLVEVLLFRGQRPLP